MMMKKKKNYIITDLAMFDFQSVEEFVDAGFYRVLQTLSRHVIVRGPASCLLEGESDVERQLALFERFLDHPPLGQRHGSVTQGESGLSGVASN